MARLFAFRSRGGYLSGSSRPTPWTLLGRRVLSLHRVCACGLYCESRGARDIPITPLGISQLAGPDPLMQRGNLLGLGIIAPTSEPDCRIVAGRSCKTRLSLTGLLAKAVREPFCARRRSVWLAPAAVMDKESNQTCSQLLPPVRPDRRRVPVPKWV